MKKKVLAVVSLILIVAPIAALISWLVYNNTHFDQKEYLLSEIEPGVYCAYNTVLSAIPAQNYETITLCCNGQIVTLKGTVTIIYSTFNPRAIVKDYNIVNGDKITVFVPSGSVKFQENISVS